MGCAPPVMRMGPVGPESLTRVDCKRHGHCLERLMFRARSMIGGAAAGALGLGAWQAARRLQDADLTAHVAVVTGGSRGLGFLIARQLLHEGCTVAICAR